MNKAYLVALREYMENLKTKTFWIGIMIFPVILFLSICVPMWIKKDVRKYAVIDHSSIKLLQEVEKKAALPDLEKVLLASVEKLKESDERFDELPPQLQEAVVFLKEMDEKEIKIFAAQVAKLFGPEGMQMVGDETYTMMHESLKEWWESLPPKEAKKYGSGLDKSRYVRIDIDPGADDPEPALMERINKGELFAYFVIGDDPVEGNEGCKYVSNNLTDSGLKNWFSNWATQIVQSLRIEEAQIDTEVAKKIQAPLLFESKRVSETGEEKEVEIQDKVRHWAPVVFVYLLWISVFVIAQMLLTNTVEEKSNKIMEVLLSSVSPVQLMAGKILGIAGTGLTMVLSWVIFFLAAIKLMPVFLDQMPDMDLTLIARDPIYLTSFVVYFVMGYLLLAAILVGIGSVCNSLKEAQNLMGPVTIIMIIPLLAMMPIGEDPNGTIAKIMSYIPPFTPFVMMNRAAGPPAPMEYVITSILLVISIAITLWAAAKVFRIGVLMTGKPPKLMEILRWIKAPVGQVPVRKDE